MLKKKFLTVCIACLALIAIVGAGFASWYFSTQRRADVANLNVAITHANTFGEFGAINQPSAVLVLDQPTITNNAITSHNITMKTGASSSTEAADVTNVWTVSKTSYEDTLKNGSDGLTIANSYIEYSILIYIKTATLGQYVKVGGSDYSTNASDFRNRDGAHKHDGYTAYKLNLTGKNLVLPIADMAQDGASRTAAYVDFSDANDVKVTFSIQLSAIPFEWIDADSEAGADVTTKKTPRTFQEYQAMVATLKGVSANTVNAGTTYETTTNAEIIIEFAVYNTSPSAPTITTNNN